MPWTVAEESHNAVTKEIERQNDRGAALIAGAFLEDRLLQAIKVHFTDDEEIISQFCKGHGPLATFSAKIDMGFLLGLYPARVRKTLHVIRRIRNEFAHNMQPTTFRSQRVRDLAKQIVLPPGAETKIQEQMRKQLPDMPEGLFELMGALYKRGRSGRQHYMRAIKIVMFTLTLSIAINAMGDPRLERTKRSSAMPAQAPRSQSPSELT